MERTFGPERNCHSICSARAESFSTFRTAVAAVIDAWSEWCHCIRRLGPWALQGVTSARRPVLNVPVHQITFEDHGETMLLTGRSSLRCRPGETPKAPPVLPKDRGRSWDAVLWVSGTNKGIRGGQRDQQVFTYLNQLELWIQEGWASDQGLPYRLGLCSKWWEKVYRAEPGLINDDAPHQTILLFMVAPRGLTPLRNQTQHMVRTSFHETTRSTECTAASSNSS